MKLNFILFVLILMSTSMQAQDLDTNQSKVAKVIILRGNAKAVLPNSSSEVALKKDDWLIEGSSVVTEEKSFVKLVFIDKSTVSVGAASRMEISAFPKDGAGVLSVIKGQIRSQVIKELDTSKEIKTKLFVKTKSAAMGVRGTDFQVLYNPDNNVTSLVTFEGNVAFAKIDAHDVDTNKTNVNPSNLATKTVVLESIISSEKAVHVKAGEFSGANPNAPSATIPTKISPAQFETMKNNTDLVSSDQKNSDTKNSTKYISVVPPGLPPTLAANTDISIPKVGIETPELKKVVSPEGKLNRTSGEYQPPAGGYIDIKTGLYIPPPPGSTFDANTGVYVPPPHMGGFDLATGNYQPPTGLVLSHNGEFKSINLDRLPASNELIKMAGVVPPPINASGDLNQYAKTSINAPPLFHEEPLQPSLPTYDSEKLDNLRESVYNQIDEQAQTVQTTRVKIILNFK